MDHLSELKRKLEQNKENRGTAVERYNQADNVVSGNELKLQRKVASLLENERMALESHKELIKGSMDRLSYQQEQNNEYLAELNYNLKDMSDLKAIYETKREIMEQNHNELLNSLQSKENKLKRQIKTLQGKYKSLNEDYEKLSLQAETKKQADKFIAILAVTFVAVVLGSWLGLGFVDLLRSVGQGIKSLFIF